MGRHPDICTLRELIKLTKNHVNEIKLCIMTVWKAFIKNSDIMKSTCLKCKVVKACTIPILMLIYEEIWKQNHLKINLEIHKVQWK